MITRIETRLRIRRLTVRGHLAHIFLCCSDAPEPCLVIMKRANTVETLSTETLHMPPPPPPARSTSGGRNMRMGGCGIAGGRRIPGGPPNRCVRCKRRRFLDPSLQTWPDHGGMAHGNAGLVSASQSLLTGVSWTRTGADPGQDPTPKGGYPPPPSTHPKMVVQNNGFCGRRRCFRHKAGGNFLFDPMCLYSKYSEFCGEFKNG